METAEDEHDNDLGANPTESIWEQQGYSPLLSIENGGTMAMVSLGTGTTWGYPDDDDEEEDDLDREHNVGKRGEASKGNTTSSGSNDTSLPETDFRVLADQALQQLDLDYEQTLVKSSLASRKSALSVGLDHGGQHVETSSSVRVKDPVNDSTTVISGVQQEPMNFAEWGSWTDDINKVDQNDQTTKNASHQQTNFTHPYSTKAPANTKSIPDIDGDAVRRAVSKMQTQKFVSKYKEWETSIVPSNSSSQDNARSGIWAASFLVPQSHPCIPKSILKLYSSSCFPETRHAVDDKADHHHYMEVETQLLTRAATLAEALCRVDALKRQDCLVIHLIGCDHQEEDYLEETTSSSKMPSYRIPRFLQPAMQWLPRARQVPSKIEFHLIGPNLQTDVKFDIVESLPAPFEAVKVQYHPQLYHEFLQKQQDAGARFSVDLVLSYNAGIWGYNDWKPSLQYLLDTPRRNQDGADDGTSENKIPVVITAYTLSEAQEDYEVLKDIFSSSCRCVWKPQLNPFGSQKIRPTATAPKGETEAYRENAAWQAWRI